MRVAAAQIAPVFLDRDATLDRVVAQIDAAADAGAQLVAFGEALVPGYPFWLSRLDAARFEAPEIKHLHALSVEAAVTIADGHLDGVCSAARRREIAVVLGIVERPRDRGASLYCSAVSILPSGAIASVHRKLMPTWEERLAWGVGDGAGLVTHQLGPFTVGALNCWENWMPLARAALQAQGEDLHVAIWPGSTGLTRDITRFAAREGRSFVLAAGALLRQADIPADLPCRDRILAGAPELLYDGGSAIAGPDGEWIVEPISGREGLVVADLDPRRVLEERHNFDPSGHYARPEVLGLTIDRRRHSVLRDE